MAQSIVLMHDCVRMREKERKRAMHSIFTETICLIVMAFDCVFGLLAHVCLRWKAASSQELFCVRWPLNLSPSAGACPCYIETFSEILRNWKWLLKYFHLTSLAQNRALCVYKRAILCVHLSCCPSASERIRSIPNLSLSLALPLYICFRGAFPRVY